MASALKSSMLELLLTKFFRKIIIHQTMTILPINNYSASSLRLNYYNNLHTVIITYIIPWGPHYDSTTIETTKPDSDDFFKPLYHLSLSESLRPLEQPRQLQKSQHSENLVRFRV